MELEFNLTFTVQPITSNKKGSTTSLEPAPPSPVLRIHVKIDGKEIFQTTPIPIRGERYVTHKL